MCHRAMSPRTLRGALARTAAVVVAGAVLPACRAEEPARAALRARLAQETRLSSDELARLRQEVGASISGKTFVKEGSGDGALAGEEREVVFGMLTQPAGMYDEGLQMRNGRAFRVLNAPARSSSAEVEAFQRLWIDVETLLPVRFEFAHAFPGLGEYAFDLREE